MKKLIFIRKTNYQNILQDFEKQHARKMEKCFRQKGKYLCFIY